MSDTVAFNNTPSNGLVPLFSAEFNAGTPPYSGVSRTALLGRFLPTGTAVAGTPVILGSSDPNAMFGPGSMLADMAVYARYHNPTGAIYALPIADPESGAAAAGSILFAGTATAGGNLTRYIAGVGYTVGVAVGDAAATVAAAFAAAVAAGYTLFNRTMLGPVTAAVDGTTAAKVDLTARHTGTEGNAIRIEAGLLGNEVDPAGITATITGMANGSGAISMATELANLGSMPFDWIAAGPYNSTQNLDDAESFLSDSGSGRWSPTIGLYGHYLCCNDGNLAEQTSLGTTLNDRHKTVVGTNQYPHPLWSWSAALIGVVGQSKNLGAPLSQAVEIARPLQTLQLAGLLPPGNPANQWGLPDRQALYSSGIAAVIFGADGTPQIDRMVTTYQTNAWGVSDNTFLDIETMAISEYVGEYLKSVVTSTYPRCVLLDANPMNLQGVVTPAQAKATIVHAYNDLASAGVVQDPALFAQYLIVAASTLPGRLDAYLPVGVANQLRVFAANVTIFQQLSAAVGSGLTA